MNDVFVEQIVEKRQDLKTVLLKTGIVLAALLLSSVFLFFGILRMFFPFVFAVSIYGAYLLIRSQNFEFEYSFTNGDLDIDRIFSRRSRKGSFPECSFVRYMAPMSDGFRSEFESQKT